MNALNPGHRWSVLQLTTPSRTLAAWIDLHLPRSRRRTFEPDGSVVFTFRSRQHPAPRTFYDRTGRVIGELRMVTEGDVP